MSLAIGSPNFVPPLGHLHLSTVSLLCNLVGCVLVNIRGIFNFILIFMRCTSPLRSASTVPPHSVII